MVLLFIPFLSLHMSEAVKYENHHVFPISTYWENTKQNIMRLRSDIHTELHNTCNIPYQHIRRAREQLNGVFVFEPKHIEIVWGLQRKFLENVHKLPWRLQKEHATRARNFYNHKHKEFHELIKDLKENEYGLTLPQHKLKMTYKFDELVDQIIDLEKSKSYAKIQVIRLKAIEAYSSWKIKK